MAHIMPIVEQFKELMSQDYKGSEIDWIEIIQTWDEKVHAKLTYSRYRKHGTRYTTHECLWIIIKVNNHWGVQLMSLHISR